MDRQVGIVQRFEPNTLEVILSAGCAGGRAPMTKITMRSCLWDQIFRESNKTIDVKDVDVPIVIDNSIPLYPGYEIHREVRNE